MIALIDADTVEPIYITTGGYPALRVDGKEIHLHRWVAEKVLGRKLKGKECVHHIDYNKLNCKRENLLVCPDQKYHMMIHARTDHINKGYNPDTHHFCSACKTFHTKDKFPKSKNEWNGLFHMCKEKTNERRRGKYKTPTPAWLQYLNRQYAAKVRTQIGISWIPEGGK